MRDKRYNKGGGKESTPQIRFMCLRLCGYDEVSDLGFNAVALC